MALHAYTGFSRFGFYDTHTHWPFQPQFTLMVSAMHLTFIQGEAFKRWAVGQTFDSACASSDAGGSQMALPARPNLTDPAAPLATIN